MEGSYSEFLGLNSETTSLVDKSEGFYGRDADKKAIIDMLISDDENGSKQPGVIPILGKGGIGKTTLAQHVYNDKAVVEEFAIRAWICVSDSHWCLEELAEIMECSKIQRQQVVPIFYHVDPSHVENQTGSYGVAFEKHQAHKKNTAETLRNALIDVAESSGGFLVGNNSFAGQPIMDIVNDIYMKLGMSLRRLKVDVFLNFRVRCVVFQAEEIGIVYRYERVRRGDEVEITYKKFQASAMSIKSFSKDYASSPYCLEELLDILESRKRWSHKAVPIFYSLPPKVLANQSGNRAGALPEHENEEGPDSKEVKEPPKEAADISWHVPENKGPETYYNQDIVKELHRFLEEHDDAEIRKGKGSIVRRRPPAVKERGTSPSAAGPLASEVKGGPTLSPARSRASADNAADWVFLCTNIVLETLVLTFDQLSSPHKPQYALAVMILSLAAMLFCFAEFVYKGQKQGWRFGLHSLSSNEEPCYNCIDYASFLGTVCQFIFSVIGYTHMRGGKESPIKISATSIIFLAFYAVSRCCKDGGGFLNTQPNGNQNICKDV